MKEHFWEFYNPYLSKTISNLQTRGFGVRLKLRLQPPPRDYPPQTQCPSLRSFYLITGGNPSPTYSRVRHLRRYSTKNICWTVEGEERERRRQQYTRDVCDRGEGKMVLTFVELREWSTSMTVVRRTGRTSGYSVYLETRSIYGSESIRRYHCDLPGSVKQLYYIW